MMEAFLDGLNPFRMITGLRDFMELGGPMLWWIMLSTFIMWTLILERTWYFWTTHPGVVKRAVRQWQERGDHKSWHAHKIRTRMISEVRLEASASIGMIKTLVAIAPLLGLLGTVTGMVEVFDVLAFTGSSNVRAMSAGVSKATLPTMAGMVSAISGLYFSTLLERRAKREVQKVADQLSLT
jgi:biopolymer transport protein ExbB